MGHVWRCPLCHRLNNRFIYGETCPNCGASPLSNEAETAETKQHSSPKTSGVGAPDEKRHPDQE